MDTKETLITQSYLRELFCYDPETGNFTWLIPAKGRRSPAGGKNAIGYILITVLGKQYYAHRLAWFYMTGRWPPEHIDHINGKTDDNRFCNLREATNSQNNANRYKTAPNSTGYKGVALDKRRGAYYAQVCMHGRSIRKGPFSTAEAAHERYLSLVEEIHGEFACTKQSGGAG